MAKIDYSQFDLRQASDRLRLEEGKQHEIGIYDVVQRTVEIFDVAGPKSIPCLVLKIDYLDGQKVNQELVITSKKFVQTVRMYDEKGILFTHIFSVCKVGRKYQTNYLMAPIYQKKETVATF